MDSNRVYAPKVYDDSELSGICGIYQIRNITNGKLYIGSSKNLKHRKYNGHLFKLRRNVHHNPYLQNAFNIYGEENFIFEVIEFCKPNNQFKIEQYWIDRLNVLNKDMGYNICDKAMAGPNLKGYKFSEEHNMKISKARIGMKFTEEHCRNIGKVKLGKNTGEDNNMSIQIVCLENGVKYGSIREAIRELNLSEKIGISEVLNGKQYTAGGLHWMEYDNYIKATPEEIQEKLKLKQFSQPKQRKMVICLNTGERFESLKEASIKHNTNSTSIMNCCKGYSKNVFNNKTKEKLQFMYYEDWIKLQEDS